MLVLGIYLEVSVWFLIRWPSTKTFPDFFIVLSSNWRALRPWFTCWACESARGSSCCAETARAASSSGPCPTCRRNKWPSSDRRALTDCQVSDVNPLMVKSALENVVRFYDIIKIKWQSRMILQNISRIVVGYYVLINISSCVVHTCLFFEVSCFLVCSDPPQE